MRDPQDMVYDEPDAGNLDQHIGQRLRSKRIQSGLSQESLADAVGVTFQQIQKYERGKNRIAASRLFQFAQVLGVPLVYFFEQLPTYLAEETPSFEGPVTNTGSNVLLQELIAEFQEIKNPELQQKLVELARVLAGHDGQPSDSVIKK